MNSPSILVVDDNASDVFLLRHALAEICSPIAVTAKTSGVQALKYLESNPRPDLLILDFRLPGETALDVLDELQKHPKWERIPTVIVTGLLPPETLDLIESSGAFYVQKPSSLPGWFQLASDLRGLVARKIPAAA